MYRFPLKWCFIVINKCYYKFISGASWATCGVKLPVSIIVETRWDQLQQGCADGASVVHLEICQWLPSSFFHVCLDVVIPWQAPEGLSLVVCHVWTKPVCVVWWCLAMVASGFHCKRTRLLCSLHKIWNNFHLMPGLATPTQQDPHCTAMQQNGNNNGLVQSYDLWRNLCFCFLIHIVYTLQAAHALFWGFQDEEVSWNTTNPDFTPCFQKTVLMWVPLVFLLLMTPYQLYTLWHLKDRVIKWNMLSSGKIVRNYEVLFQNLFGESFYESSIFIYARKLFWSCCSRFFETFFFLLYFLPSCGTAVLPILFKA